MRVTDEAIEKIKEMIMSGRLGPGDRLPREADLAAELSLSRGSLREAVRALSVLGVLDVRQGDGTYITSLRPALLLDALGFLAELRHGPEVLDFFEVRRVLEPVAVAQAATRMDEEEIAKLRVHLAQVTPESPVEDLTANDVAFHRRVNAACGNPVLAGLIEGLGGPTQRALTWRGLTQSGAAERTLAEHHAILDALAARRPQSAQAWATVHIDGVEDWLRQDH